MAMIRVTGVPETLRALRYLEPKTRTEVVKSLNAAGRNIRGVAQSLVPDTPFPGHSVNNWRGVAATKPTATRGGAGWPPYNPGAIAAGISSGRSTAAVTVYNSDAAGMIYEKAGTKTGGVTPSGVGMINAMPAVAADGSGRAGRLVVRANARTYPQTLRAIDDAVDMAVKAVERLMP